jgi:hypothetical protein
MHWADMISSGGSISGAAWWQERDTYLETR